MRSSYYPLLVVFVALALMHKWAEKPVAAEENWYRSPTLSVMTSFIKDPREPYTIQEWEKGLGNKLDADRWVKDFKQAGATYLIFYDKWIDGYVFHDTKTTNFKTSRDFLREIADACHRGGLKLVIYFNAVSDGNPEFDKWALLDRKGKPIVFNVVWPTRYQTLHSPFRKISVEQVRELMTNYGRIDGMWLDIFSERLNTSSKWVARGYEEMYGTLFDQATPENLQEFNVRTLAGYLDEVQAIAKKHQPDCVWTSNGSGKYMFESGVWVKWVGSRLDYGSYEGHRFHRMDRFARMAWVNPKPLELGLLLCKSWFTPIEDVAHPANITRPQAIATAAIALCQGASIYMALTPDHSGVFGEDLQLAKTIGKWFKQTEPVLKNARPYADIGIVLGTPSPDGPGLAGSNNLWKHYEARQMSTGEETFAISDKLAREGLFSQLLYAYGDYSNWPPSLAGFQAILLPERAMLDKAHIEKLKQYVEQGGLLIAFGHASQLDANGQQHNQYALGDLFGAKYEGEIAFPAEILKTIVVADSERSLEYSAQNLVDGTSSFWWSKRDPGTHWVELDMARPVAVAKIELVNREGPFRVTDIDIEAHDGNDWTLVKSVRGATEQTVSILLDQPLRAKRIRVKILRELCRGQERQYAELEAIRVLDKAGRDWARGKGKSIKLVGVTPKLKATFKDHPISCLPMAVDVKPLTAQIIARADDKNGTPMILANRYGNGEAILITASEGTFRDNRPFWTWLGRRITNNPTLTCSQRDRYRIIVTKVGDAHVVHLIDTATGNQPYEPKTVTVSLKMERFGNPQG
ncbi:MAG: alpha-L-fucosidase, partial [Planctomycetota bacterium]